MVDAAPPPPALVQVLPSQYDWVFNVTLKYEAPCDEVGIASASLYPYAVGPVWNRGAVIADERAAERLGLAPVTAMPETALHETEAFGQIVNVHVAPVWSIDPVSSSTVFKVPEPLKLPCDVSGKAGTPEIVGVPFGLTSTAVQVPLFHVWPSESVIVAVTFEVEAKAVPAHRSAAAANLSSRFILTISCLDFLF